MINKNIDTLKEDLKEELGKKIDDNNKSLTEDLNNKIDETEKKNKNRIIKGNFKSENR